MLEIARRAPSPHNVQPWRVRVASDRDAQLFIEKRRTLPKEDLTGSFIISTMGLFIEALDLVAHLQGLRVEHELEHEAAWYSAAHLATLDMPLLSFARLRLVPAAEPAPFAADLFRARRTSRLWLFSEQVPQPAALALSTVAQQWGHRYVQVEDAMRIERLLEWNTQAVFEDLNSRDYHDEITRWFRFTDRSARRNRDGLDHRCMNVSGAELWTVSRLPRLLQLPVTGAMLARRYRRQIGPVPTMGLLAGGFWNPDDAFAAGRMLMRFWLEATRQGLYFHPFGNLVTNRVAAERCRAEIGLEGIWLVFKIGRSKEPPASHRRSVEEILVA